MVSIRCSRNPPSNSRAEQITSCKSTTLALENIMIFSKYGMPMRYRMQSWYISSSLDQNTIMLILGLPKTRRRHERGKEGREIHHGRDIAFIRGTSVAHLCAHAPGRHNYLTLLVIAVATIIMNTLKFKIKTPSRLRAYALVSLLENILTGSIRGILRDFLVIGFLARS